VQTLVVTCAVALAGCRGNLPGTADLRGRGTAEAHFQSTGAPVFLWADTDGKWTGGSQSHFAARYEIDVVAGGAPSGHVSWDTKDTTESVCGTKVSAGNSHSGDCELKLHCQLPALAAAR